MSICRGVAGVRGGNPKGIYIHNDAGSQHANAAFYRCCLPTHDLGNGFAHAYQANDGLLITEDDHNMAWHCGQTDGNRNYLAIEVCQSMGDLNTFKENEEKALKWCAEKCKKYGITPSNSTIRLHQEVFATSCPHRSVEIHGGADGCKAYFIKRIKELMGEKATVDNKTEAMETNDYILEEDRMKMFYTVDGKAPVIFFDNGAFRSIGHPDEIKAANDVYKLCNGRDIPCVTFSSSAPYYIRLMQIYGDDRLVYHKKK